ncbi:MAG TPA: zeta toxin family protein, partial [Hydrogenophaga sp.]|nr:zeta toxin family protein [Hydrogenophaga sp.]
MSGDHLRLPTELHKQVLDQEILSAPNYARVTGGHQTPRAIILAGQPGAGKGSLARVAEGEFQGNTAIIDPDELRDFHPRVKEFRRQ